MSLFLPVAAIVILILAVVAVVSYWIDRNADHHERTNDQ